MDIANTILRQLGGNKFIAMTGSKNFLSNGNSLSMHLTKNKIGARFLKITLNSMDLYDMIFSKEKKGELIILEKHEGLYCDQLQEVFTNVTGLDTHL